MLFQIFHTSKRGQLRNSLIESCIRFGFNGISLDDRLHMGPAVLSCTMYSVYYVFCSNVDIRIHSAKPFPVLHMLSDSFIYETSNTKCFLIYSMQCSIDTLASKLFISVSKNYLNIYSSTDRLLTVYM